MRIILITAHLPRLIAQSNFRYGLPVYDGLIFYYINDNFAQCTFKLFDLSYWENRLPDSVAKTSFTAFTTAGVIWLTNTMVVVSFRLAF